ncbi:unnamed protein product [Cochlearia groenlandica]
MALLLLITLFSFSSIIGSLGENIISIDCGSTGSYVDSNKVTWVGDKGFVSTGQSIKNADVETKPFNTVRYFPTGQTNCYTNIPVAAKGQKTLVRAKFYYENYDGKYLPPSFDVVIDGKHRDSIEITESSLNNEETFYYTEVIFLAANESTSLCLIRTSPSGNPFVSSIEVFGLDDGMYEDLGPNEGLITLERGAYGAKEIISYPLDPYGRIWSPLSSDDESTLTDLTTSAPSIDITGATNKPPEVVMSKAITKEGLILTSLSIPSPGKPVYLALYFSEPQSLTRSQKRSFNVFLDDTKLGKGPIVPVFGKVTQVVLKGVTAMSDSRIIFESTSDSVLAPILSGLELYSISNSLDDGKDQNSSNSSGDDSEGWLYYSFYSNETGPKNNGGKKKKNNIGFILGVTFAAAFAVISSTFGAIFLRKRRNAKPQSNTAPQTTSTVNGMGTGMSPLVGEQLASDADHSYVVQDNHH